MRLQPCADGRHGHLLPRERTHLDQIAPDRAIGLAVLTGVADSDQRAVVEAHLTGALDLQKELVDRIVDPKQLETAPRQGAGVDVPARVVGHELALGDAAVNRVAGQFRIEAAEIDAQQICRRTIERHGIRAAEMTGAVEQRLVVAGEQALGVGAVGHEIGGETILDEGARLIRGGSGDRRGVSAHRLPVAGLAKQGFGGQRGRRLLLEPA